MIRRRVADEFWLITQHDHALLSGELATHVGNKLFDRPTESAVRGIALHDCGWPLHDDEPTLNSRHLPLDVFESPPEIALKVWQASADRAMETGDSYAALLVSLHVLALSAHLTSPSGQLAIDPKSRFEVNRFQHNQIERQELLRRKLGLSVDVPLRYGLAEHATDSAELTLHYHFRLLQAMDFLSLVLCCTTPPGSQVSTVLTHPGSRMITLRFALENAGRLRVWPWPFEKPELAVTTPCRRVPGKPCKDPQQWAKTYREAPQEELRFELFAGELWAGAKCLFEGP